MTETAKTIEAEFLAHVERLCRADAGWLPAMILNGPRTWPELEPVARAWVRAAFLEPGGEPDRGAEFHCTGFLFSPFSDGDSETSPEGPLAHLGSPLQWLTKALYVAAEALHDIVEGDREPRHITLRRDLPAIAAEVRDRCSLSRTDQIATIVWASRFACFDVALKPAAEFVAADGGAAMSANEKNTAEPIPDYSHEELCKMIEEVRANDPEWFRGWVERVRRAVAEVQERKRQAAGEVKR